MTRHEIGRCRTCAHWDRTIVGHTPEYGSCLAAIHPDRAEPKPETTALSRDGEGYSAWLETKADHGCTMWRQQASA